MHDKNKAVVLLSGGLDSGTTAQIASSGELEIYAMSFSYGQRHTVELEAASKIADFCKAREHRIIDIDLGRLGGSALTDSSIDVPKDRSEGEMASGVPSTYVPVRNLVFLSYALAWAEVLGAFDIFIGVNSLDYSGYPDCRPEFIESFEKTANLASAASAEGGGRFKINAPLMQKTKAEIILEGKRLGFDYSLTHSCYDPDENGLACGKCDSCKLRLKGFREAGLKDPIKYQ
ncbi:7-cyano-7-deazaguanine synthase [Sedimentisphaera cyanobacteriorum]|uniref:7-cyano-7-deazaguanine synthase n=1 Tax=Sedimentisphaera cyanobacteriorum TaxID=1940790 RepID=A0A1Q2HQJ4_9BACT|nr:7-cyano-7-deazaguanine synthase QueC [Sedimentisphaera cyanobacteriorum]AQQ09650.1 7-cyano-7-deazaguanine synthase [Sedimentisphaera cyanobacteriorum]